VHLPERIIACIGDHFEQPFDAETTAGANTPNSEIWAWIAFEICARCRFSMSRTLCNIIKLCCSGLFTATKRIVGRVTASQIASVSAASFFPRLTQGFKYRAGISFTSWPSAISSRAQ
jgi:hypothetical protein